MITGWGRSSMRCLPRNLNRVFGAIALNALEVYAISTPWLHQDTTTITLYGAYEEEARPGRQGRSRLVLLMGTAKMGMMISSRCS